MATLTPEKPPPTMAMTRGALELSVERVVVGGAVRVSAAPWLVPFMRASIRAAGHGVDCRAV
jgi:hypothetical protein